MNHILAARLFALPSRTFIRILTAWLLCLGALRAADIVAYDFATGLQGWTVRTDPAGGPLPQWVGSAPAGHSGSVMFDHGGTFSGSSFAESPLIPVTNGRNYSLAFEYANLAQGDSINVHLYNTSGQWLGIAVTAYDDIAWGWAPSLLVTTTTSWTWRKQSRLFSASFPGQTVGSISLQIAHWGTWGQSYFDNVKITTPNYFATQYWTWYTAGQSSPHWSSYLSYGAPLLGYYSSHDPGVAGQHIMQMLSSGMNILSYAFIHQAGDETVWSLLNPDQAFKNGAMQAFNFNSIKFYVTYDFATRAWLVHNAENGYNPIHPEGQDIIPGVQFNDPAIGSNNGWPSFNFNLRDGSGKYIYDELLLHDFHYFATNYLNRANYLKINGQAAVYLYDGWRYNNGNVGGVTDGFARAFKRVRETMYNQYGIKVYLIGDLMRYSTLNKKKTYRQQGWYSKYDAIGSMNYADGPYFAAYPGITSLANYTTQSQTGHNGFRPEVLSATRSYRTGLAEPAKTAYGSSNAKVDFVPLLSFSFRAQDASFGFWSSVSDDSQVLGQATMVKSQRDLSLLAEEPNSTMVYNSVFNQWSEGQIMEPTVAGAPRFPGYYEWTYIGTVQGILGPGW